MISCNFFFSFFSLIRLCVQVQPSGTHHDGGSHTTATRQASWWQWWCRQLHTTAQLATARQRHDKQHGGGGGSSAGSNTPLHDLQLPNGDMMSSAMATQAVAAQCSMTRNCPTAT